MNLIVYNAQRVIYQLNLGTCDKIVDDFKKKLILFILIPILLLSFLIYIYIRIKIKNRKIIETGKVINLKHPQPGNYIILPETLEKINRQQKLLVNAPI